MWNRPAESELELAEFIRAVENVHRIDQKEVLEHLRMFSNIKRRCTPFDLAASVMRTPPDLATLLEPRSTN